MMLRKLTLALALGAALATPSMAEAQGFGGWRGAGWGHGGWGYGGWGWRRGWGWGAYGLGVGLGAALGSGSPYGGYSAYPSYGYYRAASPTYYYPSYYGYGCGW